MSAEIESEPFAIKTKKAHRVPRGRSRLGVAPMRGLLPLALLLITWQILGRDGGSVFFPPPSQWVTETIQLWPGGVLTGAVLATLKTFILGLIIATFIGTVLGILIGRSHLADRIVGPTLEYLRFLPGVAIVPLAVLFVGYTESMKLYVVVFGALWPVLLQVRQSARAIDPVLLDVSRALRMSGPDSVRKVILPSVLPDVLLGVKVAAPLTLVLVLVVEISTQVSGLGKALETSQQNFMSAQVYGLIVIVGVIALAINTLLSLAENYILRYRPRGN